jgi:molecular chaperone DnaJ
MSDYYQTLGVPRDADPDQIKKAYRKLAMEFHPDRNQGSKEAEARFKEVAEAYEVLRDPERRARYDRFGAEGARQGPGGFSGGFDIQDAFEMFMRDFGSGGFEDLFRDGRKRSRGAGGAQRGETSRVRLPLTLEEVVTGTTRTLRIRSLEPCDSCDGKGSKAGSTPETCPGCNGSGEERIVQRSVFGQFVSLARCSRCGGEGVTIKDPCRSCHGEGRVRGEQEVEVEIPAGVSSENYITLRGRGDVGPRGGPRGDIMVLLEVQEHPRFIREGEDLIVDVTVTFSQAALGAEIAIPAVGETLKATLPSGIQSGQALRFRGKGVPELNGRGRGDLIARIRVWTPESLSPEQREALKRLRDLEDPAPEEVTDSGDGGERRGFWSRVKEAFAS